MGRKCKLKIDFSLFINPLNKIHILLAYFMLMLATQLSQHVYWKFINWVLLGKSRNTSPLSLCLINPFDNPFGQEAPVGSHLLCPSIVYSLICLSQNYVMKFTVVQDYRSNRSVPSLISCPVSHCPIVFYPRRSKKSFTWFLWVKLLGLFLTSYLNFQSLVTQKYFYLLTISQKTAVQKWIQGFTTNTSYMGGSEIWFQEKYR